MKAKNAIVGTRVKIKKGVETEWYTEGQTGVIEDFDDGEDNAKVRFDHDNDYWWVHLDHMKRIKE